MTRPTSPECAWAGCNADVHARKLCAIHLYEWVPERYLHGAEPTDKRIRSNGYEEWCIDDLWHMAHRLIFTRELGRHLLHSEVVVHLDGNRANNERSNLMLTDKSGAMKYRKEHPRSKFTSKRTFTATISIVVESDEDVDDIEDVENAIDHWLDVSSCDTIDTEPQAFMLAGYRITKVRNQVVAG